MRDRFCLAILFSVQFVVFVPPTSRAEIRPGPFERYAGYYQLSADEFLHAFIDSDGHYFYQLTGQRPVQVYAGSETTFFTKDKAELCKGAGSRGFFRRS